MVTLENNKRLRGRERKKNLPNAFNCDKMMVFYYYRPVSPISNSGTSGVVWLWLCFLYPDRLADGQRQTICLFAVSTLFIVSDSVQHSLNRGNEDV